MASDIEFRDIAGNVVRISEVLPNYLYRRECVAYVGAGFSMAAGMPGWSGLVRYLASGPRQILGHSSVVAETLLSSGDLTGAASVLKASLSPRDLELALNHLFGTEAYRRCSSDGREQMDQRVGSLLRCNWAGVITTNYDRLIENGLDCSHDADWIANVQNHGDPKSLGHILSMASEDRIFFVKLHGSLSSSGLVLTTQDYNDAYLSSPQITAFLTAIFLRYYVVFIGCSMDDEVVRLRRRLFADFRSHLPNSFVLFEDSQVNKAKARLLAEGCGMESIFYANADGRHLGVNAFLEQVAALPRPPQAMVQVLKYPALVDRVRRLTTGNQVLLALLIKTAGGEALSPAEVAESIKGKQELENRVLGESDYDRVEHIVRSRMQNLALQGLLIEVPQKLEDHRYQISPKLAAEEKDYVLKCLQGLNL